jgi:pyruvate formate lyase activating enzyme
MTAPKLKGVVFDIQKFSIHDGPGIRTTVFLKGCPLDCLWCHNPESKKDAPEISFIPEKCVLCGYCVSVCPNGCHAISQNGHSFDRSKCQKCGKCAAECYAKAIEVIGREMTAAEVMDEVMKDLPFYQTSGGGMTVSGGEPMRQFEFTKALLKDAKEKGLHTCVETSGFAPAERYAEICPLTDIFLYDHKESDPARFKELTKASLDVVLSNLALIDSLGAKTILRCPVIPGLNDSPERLAHIAETANKLKNIIEINILPYHPLGISKSSRIGVKCLWEEKNFPEKDAAAAWAAAVQKQTKVPVRFD